MFGSTISRFSLSGRSVQSQQIIAKSDGFVVESYGLPLPVLVNEALTFSERNAAVTINCANNGWAWVRSSKNIVLITALFHVGMFYYMNTGCLQSTSPGLAIQRICVRHTSRDRANSSASSAHRTMPRIDFTSL